MIDSNIITGVEPVTIGEEAQAHFGEFPWMVAIFVTSNELYIFKCGASIIREDVVMTAAHCVK